MRSFILIAVVAAVVACNDFTPTVAPVVPTIAPEPVQVRPPEPEMITLKDLDGTTYLTIGDVERAKPTCAFFRAYDTAAFLDPEAKHVAPDERYGAERLPVVEHLESGLVKVAVLEEGLGGRFMARYFWKNQLTDKAEETEWYKEGNYPLAHSDQSVGLMRFERSGVCPYPKAEKYRE